VRWDRIRVQASGTAPVRSARAGASC